MSGHGGYICHLPGNSVTSTTFDNTNFTLLSRMRLDVALKTKIMGSVMLGGKESEKAKERKRGETSDGRKEQKISRKKDQKKNKGKG